MTTSARRAGLGVIALLLLVATAIFVRGHWGSLYDDAFIYLRYARNLREGCGLRWNCEDNPVEGFTSPAWLALLVLASSFTSRFVLAGEIVTAVSLALMLVATVAFTDRLTARVTTSSSRRLVLVAAVALALGADHLVLLNGVVGVESPLVALAILAFAAAVFAGRPWRVVMALLGAVLVRPECGLLVLAIPFLPRFGKLAAADRAARDERRRLWLAVVGGLTLEVGVRFALFGDLVPNTFWAKSGGTWRHAELGAAYIGQAVVTFPALLLAPAVLAAPRLRREAGPILGAFLVWMAVFLWTGGDFFAYSRFAFPLVPVSTAFAVCGVFALVERARERVRLRLEPAAGAALVGVLLAGRAELHRLPDEHGFANVLAWTEIGARLRKLVPRAHLATVPIGAIGMYSHEYVLDLVGLTRRDIAVDGDRIPASALTATALGHERYDLRTLDNERPDVIVTTVTRAEPFVTLDDVHPKMFVERVIVDAVRDGRLAYHVVDMEVTPGAHWLLLQLGAGEHSLGSRIEERTGKGLRVKLRHLRVYVLMLALAGLAHAGRGAAIDPAAPGRSAALAQVLATRGLVAEPADIEWFPGPSGLRGAFIGGARALVRAGQRGEPADLYLVAARLSPEGALLDVGGSWNLTRSTDADETRPVRHDRLVAYSSVVDGLVTAVHVLDLDGDRPMTDLNRLQRVQEQLTELQTTGQIAGVSHDRYVLDAPAAHLTLAFEEAPELRLVVQADEQRLVIDPRQQTAVTGSEALKVTAEESPRPGGLVTWSVDRVRAMPWFGDDKMQTVKAVAFTALDWVVRTRERLVGDEGAKEVAADLAGVNEGAGAGGGTQASFDDPDIGWPPPPMEPVLKTPLPNEGRWIELDKDPFINRNPGTPAAFATSFLRPDKTRPQSRMYITLWDPRQIALHMVAGTVEPVSATGAAGPGIIPRTPEVLKHVVGGFNGGFQAIHGEYGMEADGVVYLPPKPYAATVLELADGTTGFGSWPASTEIPNDVISFRQNMTAIVQMDRFNPWGRVWWGGTPPGWADNIHTTRSGICLTKENFVGYFYGLDMSAEALATGMLHARCAYGVHLDMNGGLVNFELYDVEPKETFQPLGRPLQTDWEFEGPVNKDFPDLMVRARRMIRSMGQASLFPQYLHRGARDFFYLTTRAELPGAELAVGPSPKEPGEGTWRVKGLPQHGFPYAVAIAQTRPDAARPDVKVRALRIDPRAVRLLPGPVADTDPRTSPTVATFRAPAREAHDGKAQSTVWLVDNAFAFAPGDAAPSASSPPVALVSGWTLAQLPKSETPRAAVGIHDEDGMLEWVELAPQLKADASTTAILEAMLTSSGCSARLLVPATAMVMLGDALDLTMTTMPPAPATSAPGRDASAAATVPLATVSLQRRETPSARDYFPETPIVSPNVWQPLQSQRVRYFPKKKKNLADAGAEPAAPGDNSGQNP